jgi:DNA-binding MurR/RpiR family transcriptional regulator
MSSTTRKERGTVIALISDVFFGITVRNVGRKLDFEMIVIRDPGELDQTLAVYEPDLLIVDMTVPGTDDDAWERIEEVIDTGVRVLAFGPHREVELFKLAKGAGVTRVVANSQFHREMGKLIERYALPPAEEDDAK